MTLNDSFAYMPLFAVTVECVLLLLLFSTIKKRKTARISFIFYLSVIIIAAICFKSAVSNLASDNYESGNSLVTISTGLFIAGLALIAYCLVLCTFEPKKIAKLVPKSVNAKFSENENQSSILKTSDKKSSSTEFSSFDLKIMDLGRDFLTKASDSYITEDGFTDLLNYLNTSISDQIKADGGAILMIDDFEDLITVKSFAGEFPPPYKLPNDMPHKPIRIETNFKFASFPLQGNIFGEVAKAGKPELITNPAIDSRIYQNGPEDFLMCGSYIMIPMKVQDTVIGVAAFARKHDSPLFNEEELKTATLLADSAACAIKSVVTVKDIIEKNSISKEAEIASRIQELLKPAKLPVIPGIQIGSIWNPAEGVCGDYYDVLVSRKDRTSFMIGDIAGKGINSVTIMVMIRAMMRLVVNTKQSAGKILTWVNKGISGESFSTDHFGSAALINYNSETKEIELASGGNLPVIYYESETNTIKELTEVSEPIGVEKTTEYKNFVQKVKSGDIIITYTDGLVETLNDKGQQYSKDSLVRIIMQNHNSSCKDIIKAVKNDMKKFSGAVNQHDDETLLLIKIQ
ncbi:MAG: SpoIIE family protein phosphatase [Treponema sp.]|nr:SpoIIE family protein phosphatase [Treponema sp.]